MKTVVFAGGGTGGHIYPGLAVIDEFKKISDSRIVWIGSVSGMDRSIVETAGIEFKGIPCGKLRRYFSIRNFLDLFKIFAGFIVSFFLLLKLKPAVLFSKGGFVSVPPCFAAHLLKIPVITHECDFSPGLATRINARWAKQILVSYEKTREHFSPAYRDRVFVVGNPVRPVFYAVNAAEGRSFIGISDKPSLPLLVVVGGSLGARQINTSLTELLPELTKLFIIVHQTGRGNEADSLALKEKYRGFYFPYAYINAEMPSVLAAADIVLSRAGANSLWECAVLGKPMVLVPLEQTGSRGDQIENADFFKTNGAAEVVSGSDIADDKLLPLLQRLSTDSALRQQMGANARKMAAGFPAAAIARRIQEIA